MTVDEINQYLIKINEIQKKMNVTLFYKGNEALILRIVIWVIVFGALFYFIMHEFNIIESIFFATLSWFVLSVVTLCVSNSIVDVERKKSFQTVPFEFIIYLTSGKKKAVNEIPKLLSEINNRAGNPNPRFTDLETAKRFLLAEKAKQEYIKRQEEIIREENIRIEEEETKKNSRILEKIEKAVKGEVFRTIHKKDFPVSITDKDVMVIIGISIQRTELYKKKVEGKPIFINSLLEYTEKDLTPLLQNNPVIEEYIENTVKKVNEVIKNE